MNSKAIILLLAIVSVGSMGITSPAFAEDPGEIPYRYLDDAGSNQLPPTITFTIESDTYDHDSIIIITGQVKTVKDVDVVFVVTGPLGIVQIDQVKISSDGSFSTTINTASAMMKYDGEYKIEAAYDQYNNHFEYIKLVGGIAIGSLVGHEVEHHEAEVVDLASAVDYSISAVSYTHLTLPTIYSV